MEHTKIKFEKKVIFWRLPGNIVQWFGSIGIVGESINEFELEKIKDSILIGVHIPLHIASFSYRTITLNLRNTTNKPYEELSIDDINNCWHQLRINKVTSKKIFVENDSWYKEIGGTKHD